MSDALATSAGRRTALAHFVLQMSPRLGILTYLAAAWSVVAACGLAGLTLTVHATALGGGLSRLIGACVLRLRAEYAAPGGGAVAWSGLALAAAGTNAVARSSWPDAAPV
jgi:hypothetical protein